MSALPKLEDVVANLHARGESPAAAAPQSAALQAALQAAMSRRMAQMREQFDAEVRQVLKDAEEIQQSDLVTVKLANGEEAIWYRTGEADIQELLNYLVKNGWQPIG